MPRSNLARVSCVLFCLAVLSVTLKLGISAAAEPEPPDPTDALKENLAAEATRVQEPPEKPQPREEPDPEDLMLGELSEPPEPDSADMPVEIPEEHWESKVVNQESERAGKPARSTEKRPQEESPQEEKPRPSRRPSPNPPPESSSSDSSSSDSSSSEREPEGEKDSSPGDSSVGETLVFRRPLPERREVREESSGGREALSVGEPVCRDLGGVPRGRRAVFPMAVEYSDSYIDSWGAPRTQGGHEGTDLMSPRGTPLYAITSGTVVPVSGSNEDGWNTLGGHTVMVRADHSVGPIRAGDLFYYAHMNRQSPLEVGDRVRAGQVVGYVGDTGQGPPGTRGKFPTHLHLGWYDVGDNARGALPSGAMNPYPLLEWLAGNGGAVRGGSDASYCQAPQPVVPEPSAGDEWQRPASPGVSPDLDTGTDNAAPSPVARDDEDSGEQTQEPQDREKPSSGGPRDSEGTSPESPSPEQRMKDSTDRPDGSAGDPRDESERERGSENSGKKGEKKNGKNGNGKNKRETPDSTKSESGPESPENDGGAPEERGEGGSGDSSGESSPSEDQYGKEEDGPPTEDQYEAEDQEPGKDPENESPEEES